MGRYAEKDKGARFGLWEHGKRLKWFDSDEASSINSGTLDYTHFLIFKDEESLQLIDPKVKFAKPADFDSNLA